MSNAIHTVERIRTHKCRVCYQRFPKRAWEIFHNVNEDGGLFECGWCIEACLSTESVWRNRPSQLHCWECLMQFRQYIVDVHPDPLSLCCYCEKHERAGLLLKRNVVGERVQLWRLRRGVVIMIILNRMLNGVRVLSDLILSYMYGKADSSSIHVQTLINIGS
jgi:hypothetical protein